MSKRTVDVPTTKTFCDVCEQEIPDNAVQDLHFFEVMVKVRFSRDDRDGEWYRKPPIEQFNAQIKEGSAVIYHVHTDCIPRMKGKMLRAVFDNVEVKV